MIGFSLVSIAFVVGTALGLLAGYIGGWFDSLLMRVVDIALAFPFLVLVIVLVAARGPGLENLIIAVSLISWVYYARLVRGTVLVIKTQDYMRAAEVAGYSVPRKLLRHLLPMVITQPLVYASSDIVYAILLGASVSFLGLGVQPPTAEWGAMVSQSVDFVTSAWWMALFPGLAMVIAGIGFAILGDGLAGLFADER